MFHIKTFKNGKYCLNRERKKQEKKNKRKYEIYNNRSEISIS